MIMDGSDTIDVRHLAMVQVRDWEFRKGAVRGIKVPKVSNNPITVEKQ